METVLVQSKQKDIVVKHSGDNAFRYTFGSEPIEVPINIAKILIGSPMFEIVKETVGGEEKKEAEDYFDELVKINGIGKKTAEDITKMYSKEELVSDIKNDKHLPFDDDIVVKLKNKYGGGL